MADMAVCELATQRPTSRSTSRSTTRADRTRPRAARVPRALLEVGLLALLYVGYSAARMIGDADVSTAVGHAHDLLDIERFLHLDVERWANQAVHSVPGLALASSYWYALLHYVVTPAVLVWAYRAHRQHYRRVRDTLIIGSAIGLVGFTLLPMAPPRMLPGYVDTLATTAGSGWWSSDASAPKGLGALTNELAAMPSLHVGWALWVAWVVIGVSTNKHLRTLAVTYAVGTTVVVVVTANHYVLDAVAGVAVMMIAMRLATVMADRRRDRVAEVATVTALGTAEDDDEVEEAA
jgi:hypothetical protein